MAPDLDPDSIADWLEALPEDADVVALIGFVGSTREGRVRLYQDPELKIWTEIPLEDIVHRYRIPEEADEYGGRSVVWVKGDRMRMVRSRGPVDQIAADFLLGGYAAELLVPETYLDALRRLGFTDGDSRKVTPRGCW